MLESVFIQQRVFIVGDGSLFDEGIIELLAHGTSLMVSHIVFSDENAFLDIVKHDQPDMILVCESGKLDVDQIIDIFAINPCLIGIYILVAHLGNPVIDIYDRPTLIAGKVSYTPRSITARTSTDLLNILILRENF